MRYRVLWRRFIGIWALLTGLFNLWTGTDALVSATRAVHWPTSTGTVTASYVFVEHRGRGTSYTPEVRYSYNVDGKRYEGRNVWLEHDTGSLALAERVTASYRIGAQVLVYYSPASPAVAALRPGRTGIMWFTFLCGIVASVVGLMLIPATGLYHGGVSRAHASRP